MNARARLKRQSGRFALVDGIPFSLPVNCEKSPVLMALFTMDADKAASLIPGNEIHPLRLPAGRGLLVITVINYLKTDIGKYIEFSIAFACTRGARPAPPLLPALLMKAYGVGQWVFDLPVSTEVSVKGGKGIWGMPKHQANLDFTISDRTVTSQYDLDGELGMKIEIERPSNAWLPLRMTAANYCAFRGMLMKSYVHFSGKMGFTLFKKGSARLTIGHLARLQSLKELEINPEAMATLFIPEANGLLDDYFESWFLSYAKPPAIAPEGIESVVHLGQGQEWLEPPNSHTESAAPRGT